MGKKHEALLAEWEERLGLQDWIIDLRPKCRPDDMELQDVVGEASIAESIKTARICILARKYYGKRIAPYDWEKTLVHELLHLKMSLVYDDVGDLKQRYMHQMIDDLARAFVDAKRRGSE